MPPQGSLHPLSLAGPGGRPVRMTVAGVVEVARGRRPVQPLETGSTAAEPDTQALRRGLEASARWVAAQVDAPGDAVIRPLYGINTGFGALAGRATLRSRYLTRVLQRNLIVSHSAGAGQPLDEEVVRAAAFVRAVQLCQGHSGVRPVVIDRLVALLNARVYPQIPSFGSLGASGDLAPLAYLALTISAPPEPGPDDARLPVEAWSGEAWVPAGRPEAEGIGADELRQSRGPGPHGPIEYWRAVDGEHAMATCGGQVVLEAKEGLALINGATVSAAIAALAVHDARHILRHAEVAAAMSLEAARGFRDPLLPEVHAARGMRGQAETARRMLALVRGSTLLDPADRDTDPERSPPQDPYSLRCAPQVLGAVHDALDWIEGTIETEINAAVDNPLVFLDLPRDNKLVSGGNFHGAPIAYAMDLLKIVLADTASLSERRIFLLSDYRFDDPMRLHVSLPRFLVPHDPNTEGLNSGLMIPQYTAAALTSDAKTGAQPDSVDSIPSSADLEDHVSMSMNAALRARTLVERALWVVAIELLCAAQGMSLRAHDGRPGIGTLAALERIRQAVPPLGFDRALHRDLEVMVELVRSGAVLDAVAQVLDGNPMAVDEAT